MFAHLLLFNIMDIYTIWLLLLLVLRLELVLWAWWSKKRWLFEITKPPISFWAFSRHGSTTTLRILNIIALNFCLFFCIHSLDLFFHTACLSVSDILVILLVHRIQPPRTSIISGTIHLLSHNLSKSATSTSTTISESTLWFLLGIILCSFLHNFNRWLLKSSRRKWSPVSRM